MIKMEREEKEREEQRLADIRKRKRESEKRIKRLLEAAFDGEVEEILTIMDEVSCKRLCTCLLFIRFTC